MQSALHFLYGALQAIAWLVLFATAILLAVRAGDWLLRVVGGTDPDRAPISVHGTGEGVKARRRTGRRQTQPANHETDDSDDEADEADEDADADEADEQGAAPTELGATVSAVDPEALVSLRKKARGNVKPQTLGERVCPNCDEPLADAQRDAQGIGVRCGSCNQRVV